MPSALLKPIYHNVIRYLGDADIPQDIIRRRRQSMETMRRLGTPVLIKRKFTIKDVEEGVAVESQGFDPIYGDTTHDDAFSYGVGYVSKETTRGEWIVPSSEPENEAATLVIAEEPPTEDSVPAPTYRGYGPGYLTYAILPDAPEDVFKRTEEGALIQIQQARFVLPWHPQVGDDDLLILCEIGPSEEILQTFERYQLKQVTPITMRGSAALLRDRWGRREVNSAKLTAGGNRFIIQQQCEGAKVPETDPIYRVETDR